MEVLVHCSRATLVLCLVLTPLISAAQTNRSTLPAPFTNQVAFATPAATSLRSMDLDNQHRIRPGDKLSFRIEEDAEEAKALTVTDSGEVELPYFGRFVAANKTCRALAQEIKSALEKEYYHRATVRLGLDTINNVRGKAYVSGMVSKQGTINIPVDQPLKLSQAILLSGPTQWAKLSEVKVFRQAGNGTQTLVIDVNAILNRGRLEKDIVLEPEDLVVVPERGVLIGGN